MSAQRQSNATAGARPASCVIPFARPVGASQRIADAQTLRRDQAAKALEEVKKHVAEAIRLLEPFKTAIVIAPTALSLRMCANGMGQVFDDLDHIGLLQSERLRDKGALVQPLPPERGRRC